MTDKELFQLISELVEAQAHGELTAEQARRLEALVKSDGLARQLYVQYIHESVALKWWSSAPPRPGQIEEDPAIDFELVMACVRADVERMSKRMLAEQQAREKTPRSRPIVVPVEESPVRRVVVIPKSLFYGGIAASLAMVAMVTILLTRSPANPAPSTAVTPPEPVISVPVPAPPAPVVVGRIVASVDAQWQVAGQKHDGGLEHLHAQEPLTLTHGMAEISMAGGATLILRSPATLVPLSDTQVELVSGAVVGHCDRQARGFVVKAGNTLIEDLGTEFGVRREAGQNQIQVHVYDGLVRVAPTPETAKPDDVRDESWLVSAGRALQVEADHTVQEFDADETAFVRGNEFDANVRAAAGMAYDRWLAFSYELRRDPDTVAYYTFDNPNHAPSLLLNRASATLGQYDGLLGFHDQVLVAPPWVEGRFPEKKALRFGIVEGGIPRGVRVDGLGGRQFGEALTLAVWLRVPEEEIQLGGGTLLSLRDAPLRHLAFQFSVFMEGESYAQKMQFGAGDERAAASLNASFRYSQPHSVQADRWHLAAVVYNDGNATFYLDGQNLGSQPLLGPLLATLPDTPLLIGTDPKMPDTVSKRVEAFMGEIDELIILERAMTAEELLAMYEAGFPAP